MQGRFTPKNPQKYIGTNISKITFRSSWEYQFMKVCDEHPYILQWASEAIKIPYKHPISGKWTLYVPDFIVVYANKQLKTYCEMIEVKPMREVPGYTGKVSKNTKLIQIVNKAKFTAGIMFCKKRGWHFRIATEQQLFAFSRKASS
jgi:hypothetical protein